MSPLQSNTTESYQHTVLPHTTAAGLGGNSATYQSNQVGGRRRSHKRNRTHKKSCRCGQRAKLSTTNFEDDQRSSEKFGRKHRRRRTANKRR